MTAEYIVQNIFHQNKTTNESFSKIKEKVKPEKSGNLELYDSLSQLEVLLTGFVLSNATHCRIFQFKPYKMNALELATYQFLQLSCSSHEVYTEHTSIP